MLGLYGLFDVAQTSGFALQSAEIEKAGAAHLGRAHQIDLVDDLRVEREDTLDALTEADLANREAGLRTVVALDHHAFKRLHALLVAFFDLDVDTHSVAGTKRRNVS